MKKELYTVTSIKEICTEAPEFKTIYDSIAVMATCHRQEIWNKTTLIGVSAFGIKKLDAFFKAHEGEKITVNAGKNNPILIGYEIEL